MNISCSRPLMLAAPLSLLLMLATAVPASQAAPAGSVATAAPAAFGSLSGRVTGGEPSKAATVYAWNAERSVGYMVYVVGGRYRATTLFPGEYELTLRGLGVEAKPLRIRIAAGAAATADFAARQAPVPRQYAGGMSYPDGARIEPYEQVYPPGRGRDVMERT